MKPVYQTKFGKGVGNCLQAGIASLLELELDDVPNFAEYGSLFWPEFWNWTRSIGFSVLVMGHAPEGYHLMTVKSPRGDMHHTLVGLAGEPVHDPYPGGNCKHAGEVDFMVFVPLDPSKMMGLKTEGKGNKND